MKVVARSSFTRYPVILVSDRESWVNRVLPICSDCGAVAEVVPWPAAASVSGPVAAIVADVNRPFEPKAALFEELARRLWYPLCLVSLAPEPGAADFLSLLGACGYERVDQATDCEEYWDGLQSALLEVLGGRFWLVPLVAERLGSSDPLVVRALCAACQMIPDDVTVERWVRHLGWQTRWPLERLFRERSLLSPKDVLVWIRILVLMEVLERSSQELSVAELAREFNFGSGKYLRRRIRELTGYSLERVLELGFEELLELMRERVTTRRGAPD